jgi:hypothetical protein
VRLVGLVDVEDDGGHSFEGSRVLQRARIDGAVGDTPGQFQRQGLCLVGAAADERIPGIAIRQVRRGERLQAGGDGRSQDLGDLLCQRALVPAGQNALRREAEVARNAEDGRRPDRGRQLARRL